MTRKSQAYRSDARRVLLFRTRRRRCPNNDSIVSFTVEFTHSLIRRQSVVLSRRRYPRGDKCFARQDNRASLSRDYDKRERQSKIIFTRVSPRANEIARERKRHRSRDPPRRSSFSIYQILMMQGFDWRMLLSGAWFEIIVLLAILVLVTNRARCRPPWWTFWTRNCDANAGEF